MDLLRHRCNLNFNLHRGVGFGVLSRRRPAHSTTRSNSTAIMLKMRFASALWRISACYSRDDALAASASQRKEIALLLEVEGVLADISRSGQPESFNVAFQKFGLDCANWTEPVFMDLVRKTGGDEERMLKLFFDKIGWPASLPTSEKEAFIKNIILKKQLAFEELIKTGNFSLRPGVEMFVDEALEIGIPVIIIGSYARNGETISRCIFEKLGGERMKKMKFVGKLEVENSIYGQLVLGKGVSSDLDEILAKEAVKAVAAKKQKIAAEVASILKLSVNIDTSEPERGKHVAAALRAGAEYANKFVDECILLAGNQIGLKAADSIGMPCIIVRSSATSRGEFPSAMTIIEGFGPGGLTIPRLHKMFSP